MFHKFHFLWYILLKKEKNLENIKTRSYCKFVQNFLPSFLFQDALDYSALTVFCKETVLKSIHDLRLKTQDSISSISVESCKIFRTFASHLSGVSLRIMVFVLNKFLMNFSSDIMVIFFGTFVIIFRELTLFLQIDQSNNNLIFISLSIRLRKTSELE